jgi:hypothetical protein
MSQNYVPWPVRKLSPPGHVVLTMSLGILVVSKDYRTLSTKKGSAVCLVIVVVCFLEIHHRHNAKTLTEPHHQRLHSDDSYCSVPAVQFDVRDY